MVLRHALLGLLAARPMSGYELMKAFDRTLGNAWAAHHNQIYTELGKLRDRGLIRVAEEGARGRKTYDVTAAGLETVRSWLHETPPDRATRNEATVRTFFLWLLDAPAAVAFLDEELAVHRSRLDAFEERAATHNGEATDALFASRLALEWGVRYERAYTEWARWARRELERRERRRGWGTEWRKLRSRLQRRRRRVVSGAKPVAK